MAGSYDRRRRIVWVHRQCSCQQLSLNRSGLNSFNKGVSELAGVMSNTDLIRETQSLPRARALITLRTSDLTDTFDGDGISRVESSSDIHAVSDVGRRTEHAYACHDGDEY